MRTPVTAVIAAGLLYSTTVGASARCNCVHGGYGYYAFGPYRHYVAQRFYQSIEALTGCPVGFSMTYGACWPHTWPHAWYVFAPFGG